MAAAFDTPSWASGVDFLTFSPTLVTIALIPYHLVSFWNIHSQVDSRGLVDVVSVLGTSLASPAASLPCPVPKSLVSADRPFDFLASIWVLPVRPEGRREWAWGADSAPGPRPCSGCALCEAVLSRVDDSPSCCPFSASGDNGTTVASLGVL